MTNTARRGLRARIERLRLDAIVAVQCGLAAGLAWLVAYNVIGHERPFFAPIAAVVVLSASVGQRWRRAAELVLGVALGIAVADALIYVIGVGVVQIAAVVTLAVLTTIFVGGGNVAMAQAAASAVLVATLAPPSGGVYVDRFVDALVGGTVGLLVMTLLLPFNPLTRVRRAANAALTQLGDALGGVAQALRDRDPARARIALKSLRGADADYSDLRESLTVGRETATLAPLRWHTRGALSLYTDAAVHFERAGRHARDLAGRVISLLRDDEPVPEELPRAVGLLGDAVAVLRRELSQAVEPVRTREVAIEAARAAGDAYAAGVGYSGGVVVAQVRSAVSDLLRATGLPESRADRWVRHARRPSWRAPGG